MKNKSLYIILFSVLTITVILVVILVLKQYDTSVNEYDKYKKVQKRLTTENDSLTKLRNQLELELKELQNTKIY